MYFHFLMKNWECGYAPCRIRYPSRVFSICERKTTLSSREISDVSSLISCLGGNCEVSITRAAIWPNGGGWGFGLNLRVDPAELVSLPWEFLYDSRYGDYLCLLPDTALIRYLSVARPPLPLKVASPLRILGMVANPSDSETLNAEKEKKRIDMALGGLISSGQVHLHWLEGQTWRALQRTIRTQDWHIFHFIGHGGFDSTRLEGYLTFDNGTGQSERIYATELARLLDRNSLRLVLLNACKGAQNVQEDVFINTAAELIKRSVPAVLAMQYAVTDRAASEFAGSFYEAVADGLPIGSSVTEARVSMSVGAPGSLEWGTPVLYMRTADGHLFEFDRDALPAKQPAQEIEDVVKPASVPQKTNSNDVLDHTTAQEPLADQSQPTKQSPDQTIASAETLVIRSSQEVSAEVSATSDVYGEGPALANESQTVVDRRKIIPDWITIPASEFTVGSNPTQDPMAAYSELPLHKVFLDEYRIARTPVTIAHFTTFVQATNYRTTAETIGFSWVWSRTGWQKMEGACWSAPYGPGSTIAMKRFHPVTCVSWYDATAFCDWLGVQLPSELEWEKACRGQDGRLWPWGSDAPSGRFSNYQFALSDTSPVDQHPDGRSPFHLLDTAGNVWEWCRSIWKDNYAPQPVTPSAQADSTGNEAYVIRGGAWNSDVRQIRCASRFWDHAYNHNNACGFRICQSA